MPLYRINTATPIPAIPSIILNPVTLHKIVETTTADVEITSFLLSAAVAISVSDSIRVPIFLLKILIQSFTPIEIRSTTIISTLQSTSDGWITFIILSLASDNPMATIMTHTTSPARYSYLAWPNGCSSSAFFDPSLNPNRLTILLDASLKLFTASAAIAMDPNKVPIRYFPANSNTLHRIPTIPAKLP